MKKMLTACVLALTAVVGFAQSTTDRQGVTTSTNPAKAAAVERHVAELKAQEQRVFDSNADLRTRSVKAHTGLHHAQHVQHAYPKATAAKSAS